MENQHSGCTFSQDLQKLSQDEWCKTLDTMEASVALEDFWDLHALSSACTIPTPISVTSWRATS